MSRLRRDCSIPITKRFSLPKYLFTQLVKYSEKMFKIVKCFHIDINLKSYFG